MISEIQEPDKGRTIVLRISIGEIVVSSSYKEDTLEEMIKVVKLVLKQVVIKGGEVSYVS